MGLNITKIKTREQTFGSHVLPWALMREQSILLIEEAHTGRHFNFTELKQDACSRKADGLSTNSRYVDDHEGCPATELWEPQGWLNKGPG